jgi:acyl-[acyl-carrier-protein]-phospholipid O-acyltransferase/long-chain-fatty-acid--[acyl-carrier-protein] ligase
MHAAIAIPDERKGEQVILLTTTDTADRTALLTQAKTDGHAEISVPRKVVQIDKMPVLGTGKIDYVSATKLVAA